MEDMICSKVCFHSLISLSRRNSPPIRPFQNLR